MEIYLLSWTIGCSSCSSHKFKRKKLCLCRFILHGWEDKAFPMWINQIHDRKWKATVRLRQTETVFCRFLLHRSSNYPLHNGSSMQQRIKSRWILTGKRHFLWITFCYKSNQYFRKHLPPLNPFNSPFMVSKNEEWSNVHQVKGGGKLWVKFHCTKVLPFTKKMLLISSDLVDDAMTYHATKVVSIAIFTEQQQTGEVEKTTNQKVQQRYSNMDINWLSAENPISEQWQSNELGKLLLGKTTSVGINMLRSANYPHQNIAKL